jgi:signal transduction histidine kinase
VLSLRNFSRLDEAEKKSVDVHQGLDSTLLILQNRFKSSIDHPGIKIIKNYGNLPLVDCYPGQLNQVFMNIISNAVDALDQHNNKRGITEIHANPNTITITTEIIETNCVIRIADNGYGMTEAVKERLFDPFFTTKPVGKGTGLGLSISYQIVVEKHGGTLKCISQPGQGTEFWIEIPLSVKKQAVSSEFRSQESEFRSNAGLMPSY